MQVLIHFHSSTGFINLKWGKCHVDKVNRVRKAQMQVKVDQYEHLFLERSYKSFPKSFYSDYKIC